MHKYRSLHAWQRARDASLAVLRATDASYHPRTIALFNQLRRAAISVELNIVEGYALESRPQFVRHLRIAMGSAAEAQCATELARELGYLKPEIGDQLDKLFDKLIACLFGLLKRLR